MHKIYNLLFRGDQQSQQQIHQDYLSAIKTEGAKLAPGKAIRFFAGLVLGKSLDGKTLRFQTAQNYINENSIGVAFDLNGKKLPIDPQTHDQNLMDRLQKPYYASASEPQTPSNDFFQGVHGSSAAAAPALTVPQPTEAQAVHAIAVPSHQQISSFIATKGAQVESGKAVRLGNGLVLYKSSSVADTLRLQTEKNYENHSREGVEFDLKGNLKAGSSEDKPEFLALIEHLNTRVTPAASQLEQLKAQLPLNGQDQGRYSLATRDAIDSVAAGFANLENDAKFRGPTSEFFKDIEVPADLTAKERYDANLVALKDQQMDARGLAQESYKRYLIQAYQKLERENPGINCHDEFRALKGKYHLSVHPEGSSDGFHNYSASELKAANDNKHFALVVSNFEKMAKSPNTPGYATLQKLDAEIAALGDRPYYVASDDLKEQMKTKLLQWQHTHPGIEFYPPFRAAFERLYGMVGKMNRLPLPDDGKCSEVFHQQMINILAKAGIVREEGNFIDSSTANGLQADWRYAKSDKTP